MYKKIAYTRKITSERKINLELFNFRTSNASHDVWGFFFLVLQYKQIYELRHFKSLYLYQCSINPR